MFEYKLKDLDWESVANSLENAERPSVKVPPIVRLSKEAKKIIESKFPQSSIKFENARRTYLELRKFVKKNFDL